MIDIGSGRGYLSSHLCLMHGLSVVAVDSSTVNTKSAQTRSQRLEKHWDGLVRNATKAAQPSSSNKVANNTVTDMDPNPSDTQGASASNDTGNQSTKNPQAKCVQITQFVTPDTNLEQLVIDNLLCENSKTCDQTEDCQTSSNVAHDPGQIECGEKRGDESDVKLLLTGLHTCGNLAASMLEIFSQGQAAAICNVGCCYHHLDEAFTKGPFEGPGELVNDNLLLFQRKMFDITGFPLHRENG